MSNEPQTEPRAGVVSTARLGSFFFQHKVRGPELIARTVMRSPWPAGQWVETRDDSGQLVEISCSPPCWFELLPNTSVTNSHTEKL